MSEKKATFAGGCFWCTEAVFQHVEGVKEVVSGYTGGKVKDPSYREVCGGRTGHAEGVQITYDPDKISYEELLDIFFATHDPTTLNRQGADVGTQYRSAIFFHDEEQHHIVRQKIKDITKKEIFDKPIVTEIHEAGPFYTAEEQHQNYYESNKDQPYCNFVINPKLGKLRNTFKDKLKQKSQA